MLLNRLRDAAVLPDMCRLLQKMAVSLTLSSGGILSSTSTRLVSNLLHFVQLSTIFLWNSLISIANNFQGVLTLKYHLWHDVSQCVNQPLYYTVTIR